MWRVTFRKDFSDSGSDCREGRAQKKHISASISFSFLQKRLILFLCFISISRATNFVG